MVDKRKLNRYGLTIWPITGILIVRAFNQPFEQSYFIDQAYFLYMAQVVARLDPIYATTSYGYPPLAPVFNGLVIKATALFGLASIPAVKIAGLATYGTLLAVAYRASTLLSADKRLPHLVCACTIAVHYVAVICGGLAEPKILIVLLTFVGFGALVRQNWLGAGIIFGLGAMCWQIAIINFVPCLVLLPWSDRTLRRSFLHLSLGGFLAALPFALYLILFDDPSAFWAQTFEEKLQHEGAVVGKNVLRWLKTVLSPHYFGHTTAILVCALLGFLLVIWQRSGARRSSTNLAISDQGVIILVMHTAIWSTFNMMEFDHSADLLPILPSLVIFAAIAIIYIEDRLPEGWPRYLAYLLVVVPIMVRAVDSAHYPTLEFQQELIQEIHEEYPLPLTVNFEEYYAIMNLPMPVPYARLSTFDDFQIFRNGDGCSDIAHKIESGEIRYMLWSESSFLPVGICANYLRREVMELNVVDSFKIVLTKNSTRHLLLYEYPAHSLSKPAE